MNQEEGEDYSAAEFLTGLQLQKIYVGARGNFEFAFQFKGRKIVIGGDLDEEPTKGYIHL